MGFIRQSVAKITGADIQADQAQRAADEQAAATAAAAQAAKVASQEQAAQAARSMDAAAARATAQARAADAASKPVENADVAISTPSSAGSSKSRRAKFGIGTTATGGGVSI